MFSPKNNHLVSRSLQIGDYTIRQGILPIYWRLGDARVAEIGNWFFLDDINSVCGSAKPPNWVKTQCDWIMMQEIHIHWNH